MASPRKLNIGLSFAAAIPFFICSVAILFFEILHGRTLLELVPFPGLGWIIYSFVGFIVAFRNRWGKPMSNVWFNLITILSCVVPVTLIGLRMPLSIATSFSGDDRSLLLLMYYFAIGYIFWASIWAAAAWKNSARVNEASPA